MKLKQNLTIAAAIVAGMASIGTSAVAAELVIDSWRNDDAEIWSKTIIPAFNKAHPGISVKFNGMPPADYDAAVGARLQGKTAGDLITCRPFDKSLELYKKGDLTSLNGLKALDSFSDVAKSAWTTDDGKNTFCLPMASVIHGFMYNRDIFEELGLSVPKTTADFMKVLETVKSKSRYTPLAMGTADQWEAATMGYQNIGPNLWKGEAGRKALIDGSAKYSDAAHLEVFKQLASWAPYLGKGYKAQKYPDSQTLFSLGRAAVYPAGSWDIGTFNAQADFKFGAFLPPVPAGQSDCYISDHTDIGLGINANSKNSEAAKTFLNWMGGEEFAELYTNALPGFFSLSNHKISVKDPVAKEFISWRGKCKSTIRNSYAILSRGKPNLENELWNVSAQTINGTMTPAEAGARLEDGLKKWYKPHM
jgi:raffinose/stachyose/melibiose transport system substrate-binding protein